MLRQLFKYNAKYLGLSIVFGLYEYTGLIPSTESVVKRTKKLKKKKAELCQHANMLV